MALDLNIRILEFLLSWPLLQILVSLLNATTAFPKQLLLSGSQSRQRPLFPVNLLQLHWCPHVWSSWWWFSGLFPSVSIQVVNFISMCVNVLEMSGKSSGKSRSCNIDVIFHLMPFPTGLIVLLNTKSTTKRNRNPVLLHGDECSHHYTTYACT